MRRIFFQHSTLPLTNSSSPSNITFLKTFEVNIKTRQWCALIILSMPLDSTPLTGSQHFSRDIIPMSHQNFHRKKRHASSSLASGDFICDAHLCSNSLVTSLCVCDCSCRGARARSAYRKMTKAKRDKEEAEEIANRREKAALKIQSVFRGHSVRLAMETGTLSTPTLPNKQINNNITEAEQNSE
eukprot:m.65607 g.65607  ORF g.65607 m.65607 type:complete len:185 (-) comp11530_c0_seq3:926-1480(-)